SVYGAVADAESDQGGRHRSPSRWCDCGFYCVHTLDDARALACDPDFRYAVVLDIAASGRFIRYERGLRYARQRVTAVRVGRCACGQGAGVFVETGGGTVGWRRLVPVCAPCAGARPVVSLGAFSRMLAGVPVHSDPPDATGEPLTAAAEPGSDLGRPVPADQPAPPIPRQVTAADAPDMSGVPAEALVPLLNAEVALLQARLDEVQRQLSRLIS
ncbi:MAG: hypothetical protein ACT4O0_13455, partial [Pseudonocardia sp.]